MFVFLIELLYKDLGPIRPSVIMLAQAFKVILQILRGFILDFVGKRDSGLFTGTMFCTLHHVCKRGTVCFFVSLIVNESSLFFWWKISSFIFWKQVLHSFSGLFFILERIKVA